MIDNLHDITLAEPVLWNVASSPQDESVRMADKSSVSIQFEAHGSYFSGTKAFLAQKVRRGETPRPAPETGALPRQRNASTEPVRLRSGQASWRLQFTREPRGLSILPDHHRQTAATKLDPL